MHNQNSPEQTEYAPYFGRYIERVTDQDLVTALRSSREELVLKMRTFLEAQGTFRYAEGKWSVKEVIQHITDTERIMSYRALRFARKDATALPGFNEDEFAANSQADKRTLADLITEFETVRASTIMLFESFSDEMLKALGTASGKAMSARAVGYMIAGHGLHHGQVLEERYR